MRKDPEWIRPQLPDVPPERRAALFLRAAPADSSTYDKLAWPDLERGRWCAEDGVAAGPWVVPRRRGDLRHTTSDTMVAAREGVAGTWWRV